MTATVTNVGKSVLIVEKSDGGFQFPLVNFTVVFDSEPVEALKYGPNGLHLAEHVLWNMISLSHRFIHSNASTFSSGEMVVFGDAYRADYRKALESFYDGLIKMTKGKMVGKMRAIYRTEQKRVTAETNFMVERSEAFGDEAKMFVYNPDILMNEYPPDYVWRLLLHDSRLVRVFVSMQGGVSNEELDLFRELAGQFEEAWRKRAAIKESKLPMFYAPPISLLMNGGCVPVLGPAEKRRRKTKKTDDCQDDDDDEIQISLDRVANPIERSIILSSFDANINHYNFKGAFERKKLRGFMEEGAVKLLYSVDREERFFMVVALAGASGPIRAEWVTDLLDLSDEELVKKYGKSALKSFEKLLDEIRVR